MYPRRSLLSQDIRGMRKAAKNNKYLHSLRIKNIKSAVKKRLKISKQNSNKSILKKCKIAVDKLSTSGKESQIISNNLIYREDEVQNFSAPSTAVQQTEGSLAYDVGNKHTRSFSKKCIEMASIYIPCDYSYELSLRKTWPAESSSSQCETQSDNLKSNISDVMKDSLDLVLGYCFLHAPATTNHEPDEGVCEKLETSREETENDSIKSQNSTDLFDDVDKKLEDNTHLYDNELQYFDSKGLLDCSFDKSESESNLQFPNLPEKCDDLNIAGFLRPHLSPSGSGAQNLEHSPAQFFKNAEIFEPLFHDLPKEHDSETILKINRDHCYAKINNEMMSLLQTNVADANGTLFVNKESSPKQYGNPKRTLFNSIKEGSFQFGTRSKVKRIEENKTIKSKDNPSYVCKQKPMMNNQNLFPKVQKDVNTPHEMKATKKSVEDGRFLKQLVMDTSMLYSMLCGVEPDDIAFYINSRSIDPDQWAIDILDSINVN